MVTLAGKKVKLLRGDATEANRELAQEKWVELRKTLRERPESATATVADVIDAFLEWSQRHLAADTYRIHRYYCESLNDWCGDVLASAVKPLHVTGWIGRMMDPKRLLEQPGARVWGETTAYNGRRVAFRVMNWAKDEGMLAANPLAGMKRPKPTTRRRAMTPDEFSKLHKGAAPEFADLLFALYETGARPKEMRELRWEDVHGDRVVLAKHKTAKATGEPRVITLGDGMVKMLKRRRKARGEGHVFLNLKGKPWTMNAVRLQMRTLRAKLGLAPDLCAYLARHGFGTRAILQGVDPLSVAKLMGHSSLEMVNSVYVHLSGEHKHLKDAVNKINSKKR